jgi:nitroimidazol reductase NimA-like FMN-containing flavoprotein (pyridoxamine 5'-phosphate oxidase superfamily)
MPTTAMPAQARASLVELGTTESLRLLAGHEVGRIVYTDGGLPAVTPVNYAYDEGHVVIRTSESSRLASKAPRSIVAFEVDEVDRSARRGWSVVVTGPCEAVTNEARLAHIATLGLAPWACGEHKVVLEIATTIVTGYQIARGDESPGGVE